MSCDWPNLVERRIVVQQYKGESPLKVLIVEDSPIYRKLIRDHLREWEFVSAEVESGEKAWKVLQQPGSPKLVLLDWVLPDLDGIELCQ
jgi:DNA-binding response OmpR family regulator